MPKDKFLVEVDNMVWPWDKDKSAAKSLAEQSEATTNIEKLADDSDIRKESKQ